MNAEKLVDKFEQDLAAKQEALEKAQAQVEQAKREAREAAREADREARKLEAIAKNRKTYKLYAPFADEIVKKLKALGHDVSYSAPDFAYSGLPKFETRGIRFSSRGWGRASEDVIRVSHPDRARDYPFRKDGTFNVDKIVSTYDEARKMIIAQFKRRNKEQQMYYTNDKLRDKINDTMGLSKYNSIVQRSRWHEGFVDLRISASKVDYDRAIELLEAFKELGIKIE